MLSVTQENALIFQNERFKTVVSSEDKSNYLIVPRGYIVQGIHIDEANFGLQNLVDEGIVSPAYKIWEIINEDVIPELLEFYLRSNIAIDFYKRNFQGTTVKRRQSIKPEVFLSMPLNLPPKSRQQEFWGMVEQSDKSKFAALRCANQNLWLREHISAAAL